MLYLVDTNVLLRLAQRLHPLHPIARTAVGKLGHSGHQLYIVFQNCVEFWNVATRPVDRNGFGLTSKDADQMLRLIERLFPRLPEPPAIYLEWRRIVVTFAVSGIQVHDARLVAAMKTNGVTHILTFNAGDFNRYASDGIWAVNPTTV